MNHQSAALRTSSLQCTLRRFISAVTVLAVAMMGLIATPAAARNGAAVPAIDNTNRAQVAATYQSAIAANLQLNPQWSGSATNCSTGSASDTFDAATIESVNWFRSMSGLRPIVNDSRLSQAAQQAALMMHAQGTLSHSPGANWPCHSAAGAAAAGLSNLTLGLVGTRSVLGQIEDPGAGNEALGHRRWLLYPELARVGVANTSRASAIQVIGGFGSRYSETSWVSWPPAGFVPDETVFPRWSTSYAGSGTVDFSRARVTVTENGRNLSVRLLPQVAGFGDPTLGWEVTGANPTGPGDVVYRVNITGATVNGKAVSRSYSVTSFDASAPAAPVVAGPTCQGKPATIIGTAGADQLRGTPGDDVIVGLGGDDVIDGLSGNDVICGGPGDDLIRAGWGNDVVIGGNGRDSIRGARGVDLLIGGNGRDWIDGGPDNDTLIGGSHYDTLVGQDGIDLCWGRIANQKAATSDTHLCEKGR